MMTDIKSAIGKFMRDEEGASGIEYALIVAMVALVLVGFLGAGGIGESVDTIFTKIKTVLGTAATE